MATITGEITFKTRWLLDLDVQDLLVTVKNAVTVTKGVGTVFFIGETHKIAFDLDRRHAVYSAFAGDGRVTILLERGMNESRMDNVVQENNFFQSGDDARNQQVVTYLKEDLDTTGYNRVTLIFFGEEHHDRIKALIAEKLPANARMRWVFVPSMGTHVANEPTAAFNPTGLVPAGYVECNQARLDHRLGLLKKGIVREPFNLELVRRDAVFEALVWGIYFTDVATNAARRAEVQGEGTTEANFIRMNGVSQAFARLMLRPRIALAENGTLTNAQTSDDYF